MLMLENEENDIIMCSHMMNILESQIFTLITSSKL